MDNRKEKVAELRKFQQPVFDALGVSDAYYSPKLSYIPKGQNEKHVGFYESELKRGDIYLEFVDASLTPEDQNRHLYVLKTNPYWQEEYLKQELRGNPFYMVPISELIRVDSLFTNKRFAAVELDDLPLSELTVRDIAALILKKPISNKKLINDLIKH